MSALKAVFAGLLTNEPVLVTGFLVAVVGAVVGAAGVVVDTATVSQLVAYVVTVVGASFYARSKVTPVGKAPVKSV